MKKYIIFIACLLMLLIYQYKRAEAFKKHETETIVAISDTINYYINKLGTQSASIKTLKLDNSQLKNILLKKDKELTALASEFNKINHLTKYNSITILDTIKVKFQDSIPFVFKRTGVLATDWYRFNYNSTQTGIIIDSLTLPTQTTLITGIKQKWFLGAKSLTTSIINTNPYIKITKIESAEITLTQPWYKKWYIWMAAGAVCGWITAK
jgi:hypothetical protein